MNKSPVSIGAGFCANRLMLAALVALVSLTACGGGGGGSTADVPAQPQAIDPCEHGIEGGGRQILSGVVTATDAGGHVTVSSLRFGTTGARVLVDGASASTGNLRPGNVATLTGAVDFTVRTGCAATVYADANVIGAIDAVDADHLTLVVLGQPISVDANTVLDQELQPSGLSSLQVGDRVRVSGLRTNGSIVATRIDRDLGTAGYFVAGRLSELDTVNREFRIFGIRVRYDAAALVGFPDGEPHAGDIVRASGSVVVADDSSSTGGIVLQPAQVELIVYNVPLEISPANAAVSIGGTRQFHVAHGNVSVTWSASDGHGVACNSQTCGVIDSTGLYVAPTMPTSAHSLLITATSVEDSAVTASAIVVIVQDGPFANVGPHTVSGEIFSAEIGPVPGDANVNLWVQKDGFGYSYWWANGPLVAHDGHFQAPNIPDSYITIWAVKAGYVQPCAVGTTVNRDVTLHIELQPESVFASANAPRPTQSVEPSLNGMIYEETDSGRQPVAGAKVWLEDGLDGVYAQTLSDAGGGYYLCNLIGLPTPPDVIVGKPGYATIEIYPVPIADGALLDIELKRL